MFTTVLTDSAVLRPLEPWQAGEFAANLDRCRDHIRPWVGASFVATDLTEARQVLQRYADGQAADRQRIYGIWLDGTLVGGTMFVNADATGGNFEVGCWLEPSAQGRGLITMAVTRMFGWAFDERGLVRAEWWTRSDNASSIAVAKRLGMTLEGTLRQHWRYDGRRFDTQVWSLLADEWRAQQP